MRRLAIVALVAACGPAAKTSATPRAKPVSPASTQTLPPTAEVFDDLVLVDDVSTEHLVISKATDGWIFESDYLLDAGAIGMRMQAHLRIKTDPTGAILSFLEEGEIPGPDGQPFKFEFTLERERGELVGAFGATPLRFPAPDLWGGLPIVNQLAWLCIDQRAGTPTAMADNVVEMPVGAAEVVDGEVVRIAIGAPEGAADLYCDGSRMLALDGPGHGVTVRQGSEDRFVSVRRPAPLVPPLPADVVEAERSIAVKATGVAGDATLACSLVMPSKSKGRVAAVAFLHEGANYDRDGDIARADAHDKKYVYRLLAYELAAAGIGSIRCDTRHLARGAATSESVDSVVADGAAMLAALAGETSVDRKRVGLVATDDGATVAPLVWKKRAVRAMVVVEPLDRSFDRIMIEMFEAQTKELTGNARVAADEQLDAQKRAFDAIRNGDPLPEDVAPSMRAMMEMAPDYYRTFMAHDPTAAAAVVTKTSVLLVDGHFGHSAEKGDVNAVSDAYRKAKGKKRNKVELKSYADVDDDLLVRPAGDEGRDPPWWTPSSTQVRADIVEFLGRSL